MIEIPFAICSALTLFAGLYDLKTSDVHEEIPALLISFGLFYWFMFSMISNDLSFLFNSIVTGLLFLSLGLLVYKARAWGDGDAWIMGGIGFMVPSLPVIFLSYPISFIFNLMIVGGVYSLIYIIIYGLLNRNIRKEFVSELKKYTAIYFGFLFACAFISFHMPFFILIGFMPLIYIYAKVVEKGMKKKIKTSDLKEGDVLAGKEIIGVTTEYINRLKKQKKFVEVQDGIRFTMVFPITLLFLYFFEGFFWLLILA